MDHQRYRILQFVPGAGDTYTPPTPPAITAMENLIANGIWQTPTTSIITTGAGDLQSAIDAASDGDVISIATDATYSPITIPSGKSLVIRGAVGRAPKISGQNAVTVLDGASNVLLARLHFPSCSTADANALGSAVCLDHRARFDTVVLYRCTFPEVTNGSAIVMSYHQSKDGDSYYTTPTYPDDFSTGLGVIECDFFHACKNGVEGAAILARSIEWFYVRNNKVNGNDASARGIMAHVCSNAWIEGNHCFGFTGNGEAIKLDIIGSGSTVTTAVVAWNVLHNCVEGVDVDDVVEALVFGNLCYDCADEGISVDNDSKASIVRNVTHHCKDGIRADTGSVTYLMGNNSFANSSNDYRMDNGYSPDSSNLSTSKGLSGDEAGRLTGMSSVRFKRADFDFSLSSPFDVEDKLPDDATVIGWMVQVDTAFNGTSPALSLGDAGDASSIAASGLIDLATPGLYSGVAWKSYSAWTSAIGTLTLSGATQGAGTVLVKYIKG